MDGYLVDAAVLASVADGLRAGRATVEHIADPPDVPEAGECTAAIATVLALLTDSMAGVVEGLDAVAEGAAASLAQYTGAEQHQVEGFHGLDGPDALGEGGSR